MIPYSASMPWTGGSSDAVHRFDMTGVKEGYLEEIREALEDLKRQGDVEDKTESMTLLISNALTTCGEDPASYCCDATASRILESFFPEASCGALLSLLKSMAPDIYPICEKSYPISRNLRLRLIAFSPFGSHVCEHLMMTIAEKYTTKEEEQLNAVFSDVCEAICGSIYDCVMDRCASHIIQWLLCFFSGVDALGIIKGSRNTKTGRCNIDMNMVDAGIDRLADDPVLFDRLVDALLGIVESNKETAKRVVMEPTPSPTFQTALVTLASIDRKKLERWIRCFLEIQGDVDIVTGDRVLRFMRGQSSSHFMEVLFRVIPENLLEHLTKACFLESLLPLSLHPFANFPLQTAISRLHSSTLVSFVILELGPFFGEMMRQYRTGVLVTFFRKCSEIQHGMEDVCWYLQEALKECSQGEIQTPIVYLLCHGTRAKLGQNFLKLSHKGCMLLETLLHFPKELMTEYVELLRELDEKSMHHMAHDGCGGRVLERLIKHPDIPPKTKKSITDKLKSQWVQLAMSPSGSFLLEACFDFAKIEGKADIVASLGRNQTEIGKTRWGSVVLDRCRLPDQSSTTQRPSPESHLSHHQDADRRPPIKKRRKRKTCPATFIAPSYAAASLHKVRE